MTSPLDELRAHLGQKAVEVGHSADGIPFARVSLETVPEAARLLRDRSGYQRFVDLTAVDDPSQPERFELVYLVASLEPSTWFRLKARTAERAPSLVEVYPGVNWCEREVFDLFGVTFDGHPDLCRILMPDDWQGYPLRKDEPLRVEPVTFTVTEGLDGG